MSTNPDETLFADALALPAAERARFLDQACAGDAHQRARVAALLASQEAAANIFESPATVRAVFTPEE